MTDKKIYVGKVAIIRGKSSGVQVGTIKDIEGTTVILSNSRRIWYWSGASSLTQLANEGVKYPENCKFSVKLENDHLIIDAIEILICSDKAITNIYEVPEWKI